MAFGSENNFFSKDKDFLDEYRNKLINYLNIYNREEEVINLYLWAYDQCVENPDYYDGTTMTEDLDFGGLDVEAMLHDVLYVVLKVSSSFKYQYLADITLRVEMSKHNKSSLETDKRWFFLLLKTPLLVPFSRYIKKRKMNKENKEKMRQIFSLLINNYKINWFKDFLVFTICTYTIFSIIKTTINLLT